MSIAILVVYVVLATVLLWLLDRDPGQAVVQAVLLCAVALVVARVTTVAGARANRKAVAEGRLEVAVRSPDGYPGLSSGWRRAEIRPSGGSIRITPFAGPSAAPFTVTATGLTDTGQTPGWRELFAGPVRGPATILQVADDLGTVQIAVPEAHRSWLLDAVDGRPAA
jgi:hypothetical protein